MNRRELFRFFAGLGAAGLAGIDKIACAGDAEPAIGGNAQQPNCILTPRQTEGPFYFPVDGLRRDITEGRPGVPMTMRITVVNAGSCEPIPNVLVDVWHADAGGVYSGYARQGDARNADMRGEDFMRGVQPTNEQGIAEFHTVFPGWYMGRTTHIHFKAHLDDREMVTSQWYFPSSAASEIYALPPYQQRGQNPTTPQRDGVLRTGQLKSLMMNVVKAEPKDGEPERYIAAHTVGIA